MFTSTLYLIASIRVRLRLVVCLIKKDLLKLIPSNTFFDATDFLNLLISKGYKVIRYPITGYWLDIGKFEDFDKAQELVNHL